MSEWLTAVVGAVGYVGIALLMLVEIWLPIVQSEIVMTFAGFAARRGELSLAGVLGAGLLGTQLGSITLYAACRYLPEERVRALVADRGTWLGFTRDNLRSAEQRFSDHDVTAVLVGRLLPGLRGFIAVPAGLLHMPALRFLLANAVGAAVWTTGLALLGYLLGSQYRLVDRYSTFVTVGVVAVVAALVGWRVVKVRRARQEP